MAFGGLKGTLTGAANNIGASLAISTGGPITVAVGDLIYAVIAEQATASVTACGDNLHGGSTYAATSAAADAGTICTGRAYWKRVTTAGSLSSVTFVTAATTNNVVAIAAVIEGPFDASPLDANPANTTNDNTTPYTGPATGTLAQADEVVMCWAVHNGAPTFTATSPNIEVLEAPTQTILTLAVGRQTVSATTTVTPAWTSTLTPSQSCYGTTSYKKDLGAVQGSASGTGAATATGQPLRHTVGSAVGTGAAAAVGEEVAAPTVTTIAVSWLRVTGTISIENVGIAFGTGAASATGVAIHARAGAAAGAGAATAAGTGITARAGAASGTGAAVAGSGRQGAAAGIGAAAATGAIVRATDATASGIGTASATAAAITARAGSAAGTGTATATGVAIAAATGTAAGAGAATGIGEAVIAVTEAVGSASGTGAATATATAITAIAGSAIGTGAATGRIGSQGIAAGIGAAAATITAIHARAGSAAGTGAAAAILGSAGTAVGTGAATAASATIRATAGTAVGTGALSGQVGIQGVAAGIGASTGTITAVQALVGSAAGAGTASGVGAYTRASLGSAAGTGVATALSAVGTVIGNAAGVGAASAVGRSTNAVAGTAAGVGAASAVSAALTLITGCAESGTTESLLHLDGAEASTTILDTTGKHTWTAVGDAQLDTAQSKFGTASALLDGAGDYLQCDGNVALKTDFTIDFWARWSSLSSGDDPFWTVFTATEPSGEGTAHVGAGTRKIYVSAQSGNDSNTGTQASPKATLNAGVAALRSGSPDWLLLKKGDTWTQETLTITGKAGQSAAAPMLIGAYGTGARPLLKRVNATDPNESEHRISGNCSDLYIVGLDFYAHTRDPDSPDFLSNSTAGEESMVVGVSVGGTGSTITMEDCRVRFYRHNIDVIGTYTTVRIRRCVILDAYDHRQPSSGNTEGIFFGFCDEPILEECIIDNCGQNNPLGHTPIAFAHGGYFRQTGSTVDGNELPAGTSICNGNWVSRSACEGMQLRAGGTMVGNFYYLQGTGFDLGHWPADPEGGQVQTSVTCTDNIVMRSIDPGAGRPGHGIVIDGLSGGGINISDNIICHLHPDAYGTTESRAVEIISGHSNSSFTFANNIIFAWDLGIFNGGTSVTITPNEIDLAGANTEGYSDPNRGEDGIGAYYLSIGGTDDESAFLAAIRAQSKDTWDSRLTAKAVINYIRAGFDMDPI